MAGSVLIASLVASAWGAPAFAQGGNAALAESLFREGKRLSSERKFAEACPKFAESYKLDPGLGTLLNLATCHESEGKPASAWAEFSEAVGRAKREGDSDRAQLAEERMRALEPKLSRISIGLAPGASVPGLIVKFDGRELSPAALGMPIPVDPGKHALEASAPGKQSFTQSIDTPNAPATLTVTVPVLHDAAGTAAPLPVAGPAPTSAPEPEATPAQRSHAGVIASGIATGLFVVGAGVTGALYAGKRSDFKDANDANDPTRFDKRDSAQTMGTVNLVLSGGALISAGLLVYFLVTGTKTEAAPSTARVQLTPLLSPSSAGLVLGGSL